MLSSVLGSILSLVVAAAGIDVGSAASSFSMVVVVVVVAFGATVDSAASSLEWSWGDL